MKLVEKDIKDKIKELEYGKVWVIIISNVSNNPNPKYSSEDDELTSFHGLTHWMGQQIEVRVQNQLMFRMRIKEGMSRKYRMQRELQILNDMGI